MTENLHPIAKCMIDAGLSHVKPSEQVKALEERLASHSDYSIDLARIIEDLCHDREIREPKTTARFHYDMAVAYRKMQPPAGETIRTTQDGSMEAAPETGQSPVGAVSTVPSAANYGAICTLCGQTFPLSGPAHICQAKAEAAS